MNYQPFFGMHVLLSDDFLQLLRPFYYAFAVAVGVSAFYSVYWIHQMITSKD